MTLQGFPGVGSCLGVQKGNEWVLVTPATVDMPVAYDEPSFSEMAHTLQFE